MNTELKPTQENIIKTIKSNVLGRNKTIKNFIKILYSMSEQNIISINGNWGTGKTFFTKQVIEIIKCLSFEEYEIDPQISEFIKSIEIELIDIDIRNQIFPIYFNAWEYDSNEDPLLTLIYSIIEQNPYFFDKTVSDESIKEKICKIISSFKVGVSLSDETGKSLGIEVQYNHKKNAPITKDIISIEALKQTFKELLSDVMVEKANKLVIFIDELDRCNPNFAVKLLERVKHFFDDDRFVFVFSTNLNELQYTVKKFYGEGMDGYSYLDKFFDLQFALPNINIENYINSLGIIVINDGKYFDICLKEIAYICNFSLRNCNRYIKLIALTYNYIRSNAGYELAKVILFPILLAIKMNDINVYSKIINGNGENELQNIILKSNELIRIFNIFFSCKENENNFEFDFSTLYKYIFINKQEIGWQTIQIGNERIEYAQTRKILFEMLSFLNDFVIYR